MKKMIYNTSFSREQLLNQMCIVQMRGSIERYKRREVNDGNQMQKEKKYES